MINHGFRYPLDPLQVIYQVGYLELKMVYITRKMWQKSQSCNSSVSTMWTNVHYFLAVKSKNFKQMQFDEGEGSALRMLSVASRRITETKSWLLRRKLSNFKYFSSPIQRTIELFERLRLIIVILSFDCEGRKRNAQVGNETNYFLFSTL